MEEVFRGKDKELVGVLEIRTVLFLDQVSFQPPFQILGLSANRSTVVSIVCDFEAEDICTFPQTEVKNQFSRCYNKSLSGHGPER